MSLHLLLLVVILAVSLHPLLVVVILAVLFQSYIILFISVSMNFRALQLYKDRGDFLVVVCCHCEHDIHG